MLICQAWSTGGWKTEDSIFADLQKFAFLYFRALTIKTGLRILSNISQGYLNFIFVHFTYNNFCSQLPSLKRKLKHRRGAEYDSDDESDDDDPTGILAQRDREQEDLAGELGVRTHLNLNFILIVSI